jgi:hypothetical protein
MKLRTIRYSITVPSDNNQKGSIEHYESDVPGLVDFLDDCHGNFDLIHKGICSPVMDIRPDPSVARCFVFEDFLSVSIKDFNTVQEVNDFFLREIDSKRYSHPLFKECFGCRFWDEYKCTGGCLGYSVRGKSSVFYIRWHCKIFYKYSLL